MDASPKERDPERSPESSLGDLCHRTNLFRMKLIEEFRLDDSNGLRAKDAPKHNSSIVNCKHES